MEDDEARADRRNRRKHSCLISRVSSRHAARLDSREESFIYIYISLGPGISCPIPGPRYTREEGEEEEGKRRSKRKGKKL